MESKIVISKGKQPSPKTGLVNINRPYAALYRVPSPEKEYATIVDVKQPSPIKSKNIIITKGKQSSPKTGLVNINRPYEALYGVPSPEKQYAAIVDIKQPSPKMQKINSILDNKILSPSKKQVHEHKSKMITTPVYYSREIEGEPNKLVSPQNVAKYNLPYIDEPLETNIDRPIGEPKMISSPVYYNTEIEGGTEMISSPVYYNTEIEGESNKLVPRLSSAKSTKSVLSNNNKPSPKRQKINSIIDNKDLSSFEKQLRQCKLKLKKVQNAPYKENLNILEKSFKGAQELLDKKRNSPPRQSRKNVSSLGVRDEEWGL